MCSIAGWYCWGACRPHPNRLRGLLLASQSRGTSATGMAYQAGNEIIIRKAPEPAENFIFVLSEAEWAQAAASPRGLLHARATTKGSEKNNENNHPVSAFGWTVIHNGMITNDDELFHHYGAERFAEVDTAAVPLVLSQGTSLDSSLEYLTLLAGSASLAIWPHNQLDTIVLAKLGHNDVYLFMDQPRQILYWCSASIAGRIMPGGHIGSSKFVTLGKLGDERIMVLRPNLADCVTYKVTRSPFVLPRRYLPGVPAGPLATPATTDIARPLGRGLPRWKWRRDDPAMGKRPPPLADVFSGEWLDHTTEMRKFAASSKVEDSIPTAYGRWHLQADSQTRAVTATFAPYKRTKLFWRGEFTELPELPYRQANAPIGTLDYRATLEHYTIIQNLGHGSEEFHKIGFVCPWCGIWDSCQGWQTHQYRCGWCAIISRPYSPSQGESPSQ